MKIINILIYNFATRKNVIFTVTFILNKYIVLSCSNNSNIDAASLRIILKRAVTGAQGESLITVGRRRGIQSTSGL